MSMIGRHKRDREEAQQARERFEERLGNMRREMHDVSTRTRNTLRERAPGLLPWVFTLGFFFGLWKPLTLRGLFRGTRRAGQLGHVLGVGATALANSRVGQEAMAMAERVMQDAASGMGAEPEAEKRPGETGEYSETEPYGEAPQPEPRAAGQEPAAARQEPAAESPEPGPGAARPAPASPPRSEVAPAAAPDEVPTRTDGGEEPGEPPSRQLH